MQVPFWQKWGPTCGGGSIGSSNARPAARNMSASTTCLLDAPALLQALFQAA